MLMRPLMVRLFVAADEVAKVYEYVWIYAVLCGAFFIPLGLIFVFRHVLQGCGFGLLPMFGGVVELVGRGVVAFIAAKNLSYVGVCMGNVIAWVSAAVYFIVIYVILMKFMEKRKAAHESLSASSLSNNNPAKNQSGR